MLAYRDQSQDKHMTYSGIDSQEERVEEDDDVCILCRAILATKRATLY